MFAPPQVTGCWATVTAWLVQAVVAAGESIAPPQAARDAGNDKASRRGADVLIESSVSIDGGTTGATDRTASRACECSRSLRSSAAPAAWFHSSRPRR